MIPEQVSHACLKNARVGDEVNLQVTAAHMGCIEDGHMIALSYGRLSLHGTAEYHLDRKSAENAVLAPARWTHAGRYDLS